MHIKFPDTTCLAIALILMVLYTSSSSAHTAGAVLGSERSFAAVAFVTCFKDVGDTEDPDNLIIRIRDDSEPISGLILTAQIYKQGKSIFISDLNAGDASYSPWIELKAGGGDYMVSVSKTNEGPRTFVIDYHCNAANGAHVGTNIKVEQFGLP